MVVNRKVQDAETSNCKHARCAHVSLIAAHNIDIVMTLNQTITTIRPAAGGLLQDFNRTVPETHSQSSYKEAYKEEKDSIFTSPVQFRIQIGRRLKK